jgi:hypothetical protein
VSSRRFEYLLVAYHPETGEREAYYTERGTLTDFVERAVRYQMEEIANGTCEFLTNAPGYRAWLWVVEPVRVDH